MLDQTDARRLDDAIERARRLAEPDSFGHVFGSPAAAAISAWVAFDHEAVLVFPDTTEDVRRFLAVAGLECGPAVPSRVVSARLAERYGISAEQLDVSIVHGRRADGTRGGVEVFSLPRPVADRVAPGLAERERRTAAESHTGWLVRGERLEQVRRTWQHLLSMSPDGGGHNPHDDRASGGRSVLYFAAPADGAGRRTRHELTAAGYHREVLAAHLEPGEPAGDEHTRLLSLLARHWAARAVHVAVEVGLPDAVAEGVSTAATIAERIGCAPDPTARLLRYLSRLGVVAARGEDRYEATSLGLLLRTDSPFSALAGIYGGEFYDAWGDFAATLRTGRTAFRHRFGTEHFDYFSDHPESSGTFNRAMRAVTGLVAEEISRTYPFEDGTTVVDIGGGDGTLLRAILRAHPGVAGVLFDRHHVTAAVRPADDDLAGRLELAAGDFFAGVPSGGDCYLLSRVLHDWADQQCGDLLGNCRRACEPGTRLLVLERLLPDEPPERAEPELADAWDMQMLAITGGRERSLIEYEKLLQETGFRLDGVLGMPVDLNLLVATAV